MDTMELDCSEDFSDDLNREQSLLLADSMECEFWGEQEIFPRIGDDYQVEIPVLLEKSDYLYHERGPLEIQSHVLKFFMGASPHVISINQKGGNSKQGKMDKLGKVKSDVRRPAESGNFKLTNSINDHSEVSEVEPGELTEEALDYDLVPGSASHSWNNADRASFLLGLYIFARNFVQLKRFLESKRMQDILSFYYGDFYRSHEYCRWSESRKMRKRGAVGQKIFTGLRKQELLSRILPGMSEEGGNATLEVCKTFGEGKIEFEEFIFSIKHLVGINALVEAVGIGKGKRDLTTMALEPSRFNQAIPEIPIGKAWSSLTPCEIVKYLNGDYRLSKARSNDLFWEAVWPRLLARGWHSEEPKGQVYAANTLVFLVPGITKFCRRSLKKGNHYFDCVTDILNKVASDPHLMDLENDEDESKRNEEEREMKNEMKSEGGSLPSQKHCYLQPRTTNHTTEGMKFTVVDTSLGDGKPYKVRELSGLFFDISHKVNATRYIESIDDNISEFSVEELGAVDTPVSNEACTDDSKGSMNLSNLEVLSDRKDFDISDPMQVLHPCPDSGSVHANENEDSGKVEKPRKAAKFNLNNSMKEDNLHNIAPVIKRRRLTACNRAETRNAMRSMSEVPVKRGQEIPGPAMMNIAAVSDEVKPENQICCSASYTVVSSNEKLSLHSSSKSSTIKNVGCVVISNSNAVSDSQGAPQIQNTFDLNLTPDRENETESNGEHDEMAKGQLNDVNTQRRGTRNRPPTARALEAVACGFLSMNSRRKVKARKFLEKSTSRPSRRARGGTEVSDTQINLLAPTIQVSQSDPSSDSHRSQLGDFQVLPEENGTSFRPLAY